MKLVKGITIKVSVFLMFTLVFCFVSMPVSKAYAASYSKSLTKTMTLEAGETLKWILASKGKGEIPLTYEILSLDGVKEGEKVTINFIDEFDEYCYSIPLEEGKKETIRAYADKSSTFGTFALVSNLTSGTIEIKINFKVKSGKKILKTKEYTIE